MNPNSAHQHWSEWTFTVEATGPQPLFTDAQDKLARFFASVFGTVGRIRIEQAVSVSSSSEAMIASLLRSCSLLSNASLNVARARAIWTIVVQVEGESLYQAGWRQHVRRSFELAAVRRFGKAATVTMDVRLLAGQTEDARPSSQWLIMPPIEAAPELYGGLVPPKAQGLGVPALANEASMWR